MEIISLNPANNQINKKYTAHTSEQVNKKLQHAQKAFEKWRLTSFEERATLLKKAAEILRKNKHEYAALMTKEMGKPIAQGISEAQKCAWVCEYYAENGAEFLAHEIIKTDASKSFVTCEPIGIVLAIMPWNFPFWQVFRFLAPALMAGNAAVLKHASNVPGCAVAIEEIIREAGFPKEIFKSLLISAKDTEKIIRHPLVKAVTLTGSTAAGRAVASIAGSVLKKTVMELGGSDPYIILPDADIQKAAEICASSRLINSGQSCIAAKRFIVVKNVQKEFEKYFVKYMQQQKWGDPTDEQNTVGPMARKDLRKELHQQVEKSIRSGAKCLLGGTIPKGNGAYYPPTVLTNVKKGMPAFDEELFGPVAAIITAKDELEAIHLANESSFGLGAAIFTNDRSKGEQLATHQIEAGSCFVNTLVKSDPRLPFGGIKESGYGRELGSFGIREFVNIKTVYLQ
jgi:succinate-semialdehyde dehydrogenase / glutarate-semialdehyde dehydrogenase